VPRQRPIAIALPSSRRLRAANLIGPFATEAHIHSIHWDFNVVDPGFVVDLGDYSALGLNHEALFNHDNFRAGNITPRSCTMDTGGTYGE
jgi:hypothetical protein